MSVQPAESQAPVALSTLVGVERTTPCLKNDIILPSHPLDPLSPDEVTPLDFVTSLS